MSTSYNSLLESLPTILDRLPDGSQTSFQLQVACVVVLVEAARAGEGGMISPELASLSAQLSGQFGLSDGEVGHILEVAGLLQSDPERRVTLFKKIEESFSHDQRVALMALAWKIIMVDKNVDKDESAAAVRLRKALGLSLEAAVTARTVAEREQVSQIVQDLSSDSQS